MMPKRALIDKRPWLVASLLAGISYYFFRDNAIPGLVLIAWKGAGVALLAAYAVASPKSTDRLAIAAVMAFGALGDILIEIRLEAGAAAFLLGHLVAIRLYWRLRRPVLTSSQKCLAILLLAAIPLIAWMLPAERSGALAVGGYSAVLAGMVAAAWTSRFSRYKVGIGAMLFAVSDLLIFARMGPLATSDLPDLAIWPLYYVGQVLICTGVVAALPIKGAATNRGVRAL